MSKRIIGVLVLFFASIIWGLAFVFQYDLPSGLGAFTLNGIRMLLGGIVLFIISLIKQKITKRKSNIKKEIIGGIICGIFLGLAVNFQQLGIILFPESVNASGRAGFITALYVIIVPIFAFLFFKEKIKINCIIGVIISIVGVYFLCFSGGIDKVYISDLLLFFCAISFSLQILFITRFKDIESIRLTSIEFIVASIVSIICLLLFEKVDLNAVKDGIFNILYLALISGALGYTLQVVGEKLCDNSTLSSILMSLESVFSVIFASLLLNQYLSLFEIIGCVLMLIATIISTIEFKKN